MEYRFIEFLQFLRQVIGIAVLGIEMDASVAILLQNCAQIFLDHRQRFGFLRQVVQLQESFPRAVRIQHIRPLILAIQIRMTHSVEQVSRFFAGEHTGCQYCYLSLQHLVEMRNLDIFVRLGKTNQIIGFIQSVLTFVRTDRFVNPRKCVRQESLYLGQSHMLLLAANTAVNLGAILLACHSCCIDILAAAFV